MTDSSTAPQVAPEALAMKGLAAALAYVAFMVVAGSAFGVPAELDQPAAVERSSLAMLVALLAFTAASAVWRPAVAWHRAGALGPAVALYGLFVALWMPTMSILYPHLMEMVGAPLEPQPHLLYFGGEPTSAINWAVVLLVAGVVAPVAEEVVFRGYVQGAFGAYLPRWAAVVLTAALFGVMHGVAFALPIFCLGLLFGALRERFGCLSAPVLAHVLHNLLTVGLYAAFPKLFDWVYRQ